MNEVAQVLKRICERRAAGDARFAGYVCFAEVVPVNAGNPLVTRRAVRREKVNVICRRRE